MKIGFFSDRYLPLTDGVAYSMETFRVELEKLGHEVYVFAPRTALRHKDSSKRIIRFPAVKGLFLYDQMTTFFFPPHVMRKIEKLDIDIVHFHTPGQLGLFGAYFALRHHIPLVTTYHTDLYEYVKHYPTVLPGTIALSMLAPVITGGGMSEYRESLSSIKPERSVDKWNQKIVERGVTMIHNHCDLVITPSKKIEQQLKSWKTRSNIVTLPTGVDKITTNSREIDIIRIRYNIAETDKVILFVGRMGTEKNVGMLIKAFDIIAKKDLNTKLMLVGKGDDLEAFQEQAEASPYRQRIIFTGRIERKELGAIYEVATAFAFPSVTDTQGLVLNEAAWAGLPIVLVDPAVTEVVQDGKNGYYAKPTPKDLAAKILKLLKNQRQLEIMGQHSIELAGEFTATTQALKLLRLYEETIERYHEANQETN